MQGRCECCGGPLRSGDEHPWTERQAYRALIDPAARGAGLAPGETLSEDRLYRLGEKRVVHQVCGACHAELQAGAKFGAAHRRPITIAVAVFVALAVALLLLMPIIMPHLLSALWRSPGEG